MADCPMLVELNVDGSDVHARLPQRFRLAQNVTEVGSDPAHGHALVLPSTPFIHPRHCVVAHTEPGIVTIAAAMDAHPSLTEVSFASQKATISTPAVSRLIDAMEATPNLISCNVGSLRDDTMRRRHQAACMANTDKMRQRRNAQRKAEGTAASDGGATRRRRATRAS